MRAVRLTLHLVLLVLAVLCFGLAALVVAAWIADESGA
jgi:hypothetical protein